MIPSFIACDLCYTVLGSRAREVQIAPARLVRRLTGEGSVSHASTGLRSLHLCVTCGDYLLSGFERLRESYRVDGPWKQRRAG